MRNSLAVICFTSVLIVPAALSAQTAPAAQAVPPAPTSLTFEVASVRPAAPIDQATIFAGLREGRRPQWMRIDGLRATYTYMSLKELIASGYKVRVYQVSGPDWLSTDRFDITAKLPDTATKDDVPAMLQALLAERFKLAAHLETKEHPVLGLMSAKGGIKLLKAVTALSPIDENAPLEPGESKVDSTDGPLHVIKNPDGSTTYNLGAKGTFTLKVDGNTGSMHMTAHSMTMKGFADMLTSLGGGNGRPVVDLTALTGNYDLAVDFSLSDLISSLHDQGIEIPVGPRGGSGSAASDPNGDSTVSEALAKLGLKLQNTKAVVEQLVVDHVEKTATEN